MSEQVAQKSDRKVAYSILWHISFKEIIVWPIKMTFTVRHMIWLLQINRVKIERRSVYIH